MSLNRYMPVVLCVLSTMLACTAPSVAIPPGYTYITSWSKNTPASSIGGPQATPAGWPTGPIVANNPLATPFNISADTNGNSVAEITTLTGPLTVNLGLASVTHVYTMIQGWWPTVGFQIATVTFNGSAGAVQSFNLVDGTDVRDVYNNTYADTINGTTTQNVWMSADSYQRLDEQVFTLSSAFLTQTLTSMTITPYTAGGGSPVPIFSAITTQQTLPDVSVLASLLILSFTALVSGRRRLHLESK